MDTLKASSSFRDDPNFATLESSDEYSQYFAQLSVVVERLRAVYRSRESENSYEAASVSYFLDKLLYTIQLLRLKYTYRSGDKRSLWVDLTESGFPNFAEISNLDVDRELREKRLQQLPFKSELKRAALDFMFVHHEEPLDTLSQLAQRIYLETLDSAKTFLPFTPGELDYKWCDPESRHYVYSWACYDFQTNRPYVHIMTFDQDSNAPDVETPWGIERTFLDTVRREGSRTPDIGILALAIDDALEEVHPKIIKRISLGPLYSRQLLEGRPVNYLDQREVVLRNVFSKYSRRDDDFVLFFTDEIVFSKQQVVSQSLFSSKEKVREVFAIADDDLECSSRRASFIHPYVLMPHYLLQHMEAQDKTANIDFQRAKKLTFDKRGEVHGI